MDAKPQEPNFKEVTPEGIPSSNHSLMMLFSAALPNKTLYNDLFLDEPY